MPEILTESFCERCGTRYTFESAAPTEDEEARQVQDPLEGPEELRPQRRFVDGRGHGGRSERRRARGDVAPARRLPRNLQLLHDVPPVHVRQLLEPGRGSLPDMRAAPRSRDHAGALPRPGPDARRAAPCRRCRLADVGPGQGRAGRAAPAPDLDEILAINRLARISEPQIPEAVAPPVEAVARPRSTPAGAWPIATEPGLEAAAQLESVRGRRGRGRAPIAGRRRLEVGRPRSPRWPTAEAASRQPEARSSPRDRGARHGRASRPASTSEPRQRPCRTAALLSKFRPGQNIDAELAAYEASVGAEPAVEAPTTEQVAEPIEAAAEPIRRRRACLGRTGDRRRGTGGTRAGAEPVAAVDVPEPEPVAAFEAAARSRSPWLLRPAAPVEEAASRGRRRGARRTRRRSGRPCRRGSRCRARRASARAQARAGGAATGAGARPSRPRRAAHLAHRRPRGSRPYPRTATARRTRACPQSRRSRDPGPTGAARAAVARQSAVAGRCAERLAPRDSRHIHLRRQRGPLGRLRARRRRPARRARPAAASSPAAVAACRSPPPPASAAAAAPARAADAAAPATSGDGRRLLGRQHPLADPCRADEHDRVGQPEPGERDEDRPQRSVDEVRP